MGRCDIYSVTKETLNAVSDLITEDAAYAIEEGIPATVLYAVKDKTAIGALCGAFDSNIFEIDSIYVAEQYRRQGVGRALMEELFMMIEELDRSGDTGLVIRAEFTLVDSQSLTLPPFLLYLGFTKEEIYGPVFYKASPNDFDPQMEPHDKGGKRICSFSSLTEEERDELAAYCEQGEYSSPEEGLFSEDVDLDTSLVMFSENGALSYICLEKLTQSAPETEDVAAPPLERRLRVHYMSQAHPGDVILIFSEMMEKLRNESATDTELFFLPADESGLKQLKYLFPDARSCSERYMLYEIPKEDGLV